jgi:phosphate starvation-inducible protein PhoH and related proteins
MTRRQASQTKAKSRDRRQQRDLAVSDDQLLPEVRVNKAPPLEAQTPNQKRYISAIKSSILIYGLGPAGTGKTYIAASLAAQFLEAKRFEKIIVTRPCIEAGESLGFLPGEVEDKYAPYLAPVRVILNERLGKTHVDYLLKAGRIEAVPFAYMRGHTFKDAIVILDEAQNATKEQMKLFLTRLGVNTIAIVNGDQTQSDIGKDSGLIDAVSRTKQIEGVRVVEFGVEDVVRSGLVAAVHRAYEAPQPS